MIPHTVTKTILLPPIISTNAMVQYMAFDRSGFDYCTIDVFAGTQTTTTHMFQTVVVSEHDTITSPSNMTAIVALSGSNATSTTYGFALGTLSATTIGSVITLEFDLKPRKKYIGLTILCTASAGAETAAIGAIAKLSRAEESPDSAVKKDGVNLFDTAVTGCITLVTV